MSSPEGRRSRRAARPARLAAAVLLAAAATAATAQTAATLPVRPEWRETAREVAQAGVPLADLAPNAPDRHVVQPGDTLWDISTLFLRAPWRWPELWGMNLAQIRNPHLIYPGQVLVLERDGGRARLRLAGSGEPAGTVRLSPRVRAETLAGGAIASIPLHLIAPFLDEATVFDGDALDAAPRIVATQEGRVMLSRGEVAYVRGDLAGARDFRLFRQLVPLLDPVTGEVLGHEGRYVGTAELKRVGNPLPLADNAAAVPDTFRITSARIEAKAGDRLSPVPQQELLAYVPHAPTQPVDGRIVKIYGDGLRAGQNQIVALNRGARDGLERGHVLALWRSGRATVDATQPGQKVALRLPDERHGTLFVFRVFDRVSYALILDVQEPVAAGDRYSQP